LLGATDRASRLAERLAACFVDGRAPAQVEHTTAAMVGQRAFGIALGYDDLVDHDQLRHEPVPAILAGKLETKRKSCAPLAGKSTPTGLSIRPLARAAATRWGTMRQRSKACSSTSSSRRTRRRPREIVLDLDATKT
jgi:Transposase DDE domain group 1